MPMRRHRSVLLKAAIDLGTLPADLCERLRLGFTVRAAVTSTQAAQAAVR